MADNIIPQPFLCHMSADLNNIFQTLHIGYVIFISKTMAETKIWKKVETKKVVNFSSEAPWDPEAWSVLYCVCHHKHFQTFQQ